jgi:hypothetical protein
MLGLKVTVNGKVVCVAAVPASSQLQSTVVLGGSFAKPELSVNGYIEKETPITEHLEWGKQHLKAGDTISIELVETERPDKPVASSTFDGSASVEEMNKRIEEDIAKLRLRVELEGKEAVMAPPKGTFCSFCGKEKGEVTKMVAGPAVFICNECISICNDILFEKYDEHGRWPERNA